MENLDKIHEELKNIPNYLELYVPKAIDNFLIVFMLIISPILVACYMPYVTMVVPDNLYGGEFWHLFVGYGLMFIINYVVIEINMALTKPYYLASYESHRKHFKISRTCVLMAIRDGCITKDDAKYIEDNII